VTDKAGLTGKEWTYKEESKDRTEVTLTAKSRSSPAGRTVSMTSVHRTAAVS
jgi:hypothetical protein